MNFKLIYIKYILEGWLNYLLDFISDIKYKKEFDERLAICNECSENTFNFCDKCDCFIPAKTKSEDSKCPLGKWKTIKETLKDERRH